MFVAHNTVLRVLNISAAYEIIKGDTGNNQQRQRIARRCIF